MRTRFTEHLGRMSKRRRLELAVEIKDEPEVRRPQTRGECENGPRPCPFVSCRYHLYLDVNPRNGNIRYNTDPKTTDATQLAESCALDVAESGARTLKEIGVLLNITRERVRQLENLALEHVQQRNGARLAIMQELAQESPHESLQSHRVDCRSRS